MKKLTVISLIILMFFSSCGKQADFSNKNGIEIIGDGKYEWLTSTEYGEVLFIESDGLEVSGTSEKKMLIDIDAKVKSFTISNLNQGESEIEILFSSRNDTHDSIDLTFKGENTLTNISGGRKLNLHGESEEDQLNISKRISMTENINITNGVIKSPYIETYENLTIAGESRVYLAFTENVEEDIDELISVSGNLYLDLEGAGCLECITQGLLDSIVVWEKIELGQNTIIRNPQNGHTGEIGVGYEQYVSIIEGNGKSADYILIESKD